MWLYLCGIRRTQLIINVYYYGHRPWLSLLLVWVTLLPFASHQPTHRPILTSDTSTASSSSYLPLTGLSLCFLCNPGDGCEVATHLTPTATVATFRFTSVLVFLLLEALNFRVVLAPSTWPHALSCCRAIGWNKMVNDQFFIIANKVATCRLVKRWPYRTKLTEGKRAEFVSAVRINLISTVTEKGIKILFFSFFFFYVLLDHENHPDCWVLPTGPLNDSWLFNPWLLMVHY